MLGKTAKQVQERAEAEAYSLRQKIEELQKFKFWSENKFEPQGKTQVQALYNMQYDPQNANFTLTDYNSSGGTDANGIQVTMCAAAAPAVSYTAKQLLDSKVQH